MQRFEEKNLLDTYLAIQREIRNELEVEFIFHSNAIEGSRLPKWCTGKIVRGITRQRKKRSKDKDILMAQSQRKAVSFIRELACIHNYDFSEADVKRIHSLSGGTGGRTIWITHLLIVIKVTGSFWDNETLKTGKRILRFVMTPHVHHWDSMMIFENITKSLFPSDLFMQPGIN